MHIKFNTGHYLITQVFTSLHLHVMLSQPHLVFKTTFALLWRLAILRFVSYLVLFHLFVNVPRPRDSEGTFSVIEQGGNQKYFEGQLLNFWKHLYYLN